MFLLCLLHWPGLFGAPPGPGPGASPGLARGVAHHDHLLLQYSTVQYSTVQYSTVPGCGSPRSPPPPPAHSSDPPEFQLSTKFRGSFHFIFRKGPYFFKGPSRSLLSHFIIYLLGSYLYVDNIKYMTVFSSSFNSGYKYCCIYCLEMS